MAVDPSKPGDEGGKPQDPPAEPQDPKGGEGGEPQDPPAGEGGKDPNIHKLERDVANRDKRIKELEEQLEAATGGQKTAEERIAAIEEQLKAMEGERDAAKADAELTAAGCIDCELGRAALASFGGDVEKLKEAKPYLFGARGAGASTGGKPEGSIDPDGPTIAEGVKARLHGK
ncbi:hypothetical protein [Enorma sp.]|uniref:hypothetical protein n=1 Tax=Enorma sp. TaxID=1920692 RepID=UPI0025C39C35|nr:hypothetical protein [Enorma sp.]